MSHSLLKIRIHINNVRLLFAADAATAATGSCCMHTQNLDIAVNSDDSSLNAYRSLIPWHWLYTVIKYIHYCFCFYAWHIQPHRTSLAPFCLPSLHGSPNSRSCLRCHHLFMVQHRKQQQQLYLYNACCIPFSFGILFTLSCSGITHEYCYCYCDR